MKLCMTLLFSALWCMPCVAAFAPSAPALSTRVGTELHLFGSGGGKDGEKKGPNMMDQLAMLKKAQEMAQKKQKLDEELKQMTFVGEAADGKVQATFKFVPIVNPMDPNPEYDPIKFEFEDAFFEASSPEELSAAVKSAVLDAMAKTNLAVQEKYAVLQSDLMEAFGQKS